MLCSQVLLLAKLFRNNYQFLNMKQLPGSTQKVHSKPLFGPEITLDCLSLASSFQSDGPFFLQREFGF